MEGMTDFQFNFFIRGILEILDSSEGLEEDKKK